MKKKCSIMDSAGKWDKKEADRISKELKEERKAKTRHINIIFKRIPEISLVQ